MRRICLWLWTAAFLSAVCLPVGAVSTSASSAILMDADSGRVLYEQNADEPRLIASVTKLLTALVAVERGPDLDRVVEIKAEWLSGVEGSSIYLQAGEQISMEALLYRAAVGVGQRRGGGGGLCQRWQRGKVRAVDESESQGAWDVQLSLYQCQRP